MKKIALVMLLAFMVGLLPQGAGGWHNRFGGKASWYSQTGSIGACGWVLKGPYAAHRTLPCGTALRVKKKGTKGPWVRAVVKDRGPFIAGRSLDLRKRTFAKLAPVGAGVIKIRARIKH